MKIKLKITFPVTLFSLNFIVYHTPKYDYELSLNLHLTGDKHTVNMRETI